MQRLTDLVHHKRSKSNSNPNLTNTQNNISQSFLWSWGNLSSYIPAKNKQRTPLLTESLDTQRIASITCDSRHIIVVTRDGIIFLWELGKSLKKISKKIRYLNYKNRPESLHKLVNMMRNQLPIVSNFEITQNNPKNNKNSTISNDISFSLNKRIFYGSDAVKWLLDHEAVDDETESIRFCQALLNDGRMECANKKNENKIFENNKSGLYYFSDSKKKTSTDYMQKFHAVPADPTLKFSIVASNQHYVYTITQNGQLFEWDLKQRSIYLKNNFVQKKVHKSPEKQYRSNFEQEEYEYEEQSESVSDPLDSSKEQGSASVHNIKVIEVKNLPMSLNGMTVESYPTDSTDSGVGNNCGVRGKCVYEFESELKDKLSREQENYARCKNEKELDVKLKKKKVQETVKQIASKWIEPQEFFIGGDVDPEEKVDECDNDSLPEMLLLEKLSCRPTLIHTLPVSTKCNMRYVSCGHDFVIVLSSNGELYSWGNGYHGKLGHNNQDTYTSPHMVQYFVENNVVINKIECGYDHSVCISNNGEMYAWGSNRNGKLGIGDANINFVTVPHKIRLVNEFYNNKFHFEYVPSVIMQLSESYNISKQRNNENMERMFETFLEKEAADGCEILRDIFIIDIACGFGHNLAVIAGTGQIYSWGANLCGQLGLNDQTDRYLPTLIQQYQHPVYKQQQYIEEKVNNNDIQRKNGIIQPPINPFSAPPLPSYYNNNDDGDGDDDVNEDNPVIGVGCGAFHSSALTMNGDVYCWGDNSEGQLGIGEMKYNDTDDILTPQLVDYLSGIDTTNICCGADFTFAVTHNFIHYQNDYFHIKNQEKLNQRKLHYKSSKINKYLDKFRKNKLLKPQANRQAGLPAKIASERRKHQKEIEKLQEIFNKVELKRTRNRKKKDNNKKIEEDKKNNININKKKKSTKPEKKKNLKNIINIKNKTNNNLEFEEKGYKESDINKAVEYWCKIGLNDFDKQRNSPKLRESVWKVGIPTRLRGKVWPLALGNQLNVNKTLYKLFEIVRAKQINDKNIMIGNESTIKYISVDLGRTFPSLSYFQDDGPLNETLHSLLETYCFFRPDRGYIQGMSYLAANFLLYMDSYNAFVCFANLLNQQFFHCLLSLNDEIIQPRIDIFNGLFQHNEAVLYKRFSELYISPKEYFLDWVISLFTKKLSIPVASRVWDIILIFGEMEIYRCCVAILKCLRQDLLFAGDDNIRRQLKLLPNKLKESQLIFVMKTIKVPKKLKQQLQKINSHSM